MNLYEFVTNILNSSGKSNRRAHELGYTSNREYEDTLLMLFMAAQKLGYCGLNCYYSKGSRGIDTVRIFKLDFTKKIESLQLEIQKKQTELDNLTREKVVQETKGIVSELLRDFPNHTRALSIIKARMGMLEKFFSDMKESDKYKILLIKSLAYQTAHQIGQIECCADADASQVALMYIFSTVREVLNNKVNSEECAIEFTQSYIKGILPEESYAPELVEEQIDARFESRQQFLKNMIAHYKTDVEQIQRKQIVADTVMELLTTVYYIPSNWTIETVDDTF